MKKLHFKILAVSTLVLAPSVFANPLGGIVASGNAAIHPSGSLLTITQTTPTAIINWSSFNIGAGQSTIFQFTGAAGANSSVLNRVNSTSPSVISGLLESTFGPKGAIGGTVLVLNPNGILFSSTATVNVGNLTASTLGISDSAYLKGGTLSLAGGSTAPVVNEGYLHASGDIFLIANSVQNSGAIDAGNTAGLAAGNSVTLMQSGLERLTVNASQPGGASTGVNNTGAIQTAVADLAAAGGNIYALAINNGGVVRATTVTESGGHIYLQGNGGKVVNSGTLDASATKGAGGAVEVTGGNVSLTSSSVINASGPSAGGTVLVGGGSHGTDSSIPDATATTVAAGATINASATADGNGGNVVVWGNSDTFAGNVTTKGGVSGGNGGHVEVSGDTLGFKGMVTTTAPKGSSGMLLLDPVDETIDNNPADVGATQWSTLIAQNTPQTITANHLTLEATLGGSPSVDLASAQNYTFIAESTLVDTAIIKNTQATSSTTLSLQSGGSMTISGAINLGPTGGTPVGTISLMSAGNVSIGADLAASTVSVQSGSTGLGGNISWAANNLTVSADTQIYQAGDAGSTTSYADLSGNVSGHAPQFLNAAGNDIPSSFVFEQDAAIGGAGQTPLPAITQFGPSSSPVSSLVNASANPMAYTVQSDGGDVTLASGVGANVAGSALTLNANGTVNLNDSLNLASLGVTGPSINFNGGSVTTVGGQIYSGASTLVSDEVNTGTTINYTGTVDGGFSLKDIGSTTFGEAVGGTAPLASVTDTGTTAINGGSVATSGAQTYNDLVTLGANTALNSGTIELAGVAGAGFNLTLNNTGAATLNGVESGIGTLTASASAGASLTVDNTISAGSLVDNQTTTLNGTGGSETITTTGGDQNYTKTVTLGANTTLNSGTIELAGVTGAGFNLTLNNTGAATLNGAESSVGTLTASASPSASLTVDNTISAGSVVDNQATTLNGTGGSETITTTGGDQDYTKTVTLGANTTLNSGTIELAGVTGAGFNLTLNNTGAATLNGAETAVGTLTASASPGASLTVDNTISAGSLVDNQTTTLNGTGGSETITTTGGDQNYTKTVTLGANTTLNGGTIELAGVTGAGFNLTLNNTGAATLNGAESSVGTLTASASPSASLTVDNTISAGSVVDNQATTLNGTGGSETITTTGGDQDYTKTVTLGANTTLNSGTIELAGVTGAGFNLTLNNTGAATLNGVETAVGTLTASASPGASLTVDNTISAGSLVDNQTTTLNGTGGSETITTTGGDQDYTKTVTLGANTVLGGATIELSGVTGAGFNLTLNNTGAATLNGAESGVGTLTASASPSASLTVDNTISAGSVVDNQATTLNGASGSETITTTGGDQDYTKTVTLGANTTLNSETIELAGVAGAGFNLTLNNTGVATLNGAESGLGALTANGTGSLVVNNTIAGASVSDNEITALSGGSVATTGTQTYSDAVTLGANDVLTSTGTGVAGNITFASPVNGADSLTVNTSGTTTFSGAVAVQSLTVDQSDTLGSIALNGGAVTTTTGQTYDAAVTLGANTVLKDTGTGAITFGPSATITGTSETLDVETTGATAATFGGAVNVQSLTVEQSDTLGSIALNGGSVTTTAGGQTYGGAVTLGGNTAETLTAGTVTFGGPVSEASGQNNNLTVGGALIVNGGSVNTGTGNQTYGSTVTGSGDVALTGGALQVTGAFTAPNGTLTANGALTAGNIVSAQNVGLTTATIAGDLTATTGSVGSSGTISAQNISASQAIDVGGIGNSGNVTAGTSVTVNGSANLTGALTATAGSVATGNVNAALITAATGVSVNGNATVTGAISSTTGNLAVGGANNTVQAGSVTATAGSVSLTGTTTTGAVTAGENVNLTGTTTATTISTGSSGSIASSGGNLTASALMAGEGITTGNANVSGVINAGNGGLSAPGATISASSISAGTSVTTGNVTAGSIAAGTGVTVAGNATVTGAISSTTGNLAVGGANNSVQAGSVTATAGSVSLTGTTTTGAVTAGENINLTGTTTATTISTGSSGSIASSGGNLTASALMAGEGITTGNANVSGVINAGNGGLSAPGATISASSISAGTSVTTGNVTAGSIAAGTGVTVAGNATVTGAISSTADNITVGGANNTVQAASITAPGGSVNLTGTTTTGIVHAGGNVNLTGSTTATAISAGSSGSVTSSGGSLAASSIAAGRGVSVAGNATVTGAISATAGNVVLGGANSIVRAGSITASSGNVNLTGTTTIGNTAASGSINANGAENLTGVVHAGSGPLSLDNVTVTGSATLESGASGNSPITINGNLTTQKGSTLQIDNPLTIDGTVDAAGTTTTLTPFITLNSTVAPTFNFNLQQDLVVAGAPGPHLTVIGNGHTFTYEDINLNQIGEFAEDSLGELGPRIRRGQAAKVEVKPGQGKQYPAMIPELSSFPSYPGNR